MKYLQLTRTKTNLQSVAKREYNASKFLPYLMHWDNDTILCTQNRLLQVIKCKGYSFETADDTDLDIKKVVRNSMLKGMSSPKISLNFYLIRRKEEIYPENYSNPDMPDGFASMLDNKWVAIHANRKTFVNDIYITVTHEGQIGTEMFSFLKSLLTGKTAETQLSEIMKNTFEELNDATDRILNSLNDYGPKKLGLVKIGNTYYSEPAEFLYKVANLGERKKIIYTPDNLGKFLIDNRLYFGRRTIEMKRFDGESKYAGIVSIKEYGPKTWPGMLDSFLRLPFEFVMSQSFKFSNRQAAINSMQLQQNRMIQAEDKAVSQIVEISEALDRAMSGEIAFGKHHITILCMANSIKQLENNLSVVAVELTNTGGIGVRENVNMEPAFWSQFPGNTDFIVRNATINTNNLASLASMHNYPIGKAKNNHWGDYVTVLDTTSGTPYYFNFHLRDVGHTTIIGPTGAGKTVLMNFLCAQAQKFNCRLFFFDKDRGAEIFLRAMGGQYNIIDPGMRCGINPLQLDDTPDNRTFLNEWMKLLVTVNDETINAQDIALISMAIEGNFKLKKEDRKLSNIAPFLGLEGPDTIAGRLAMWHSGGSHANVFDNDIDNLDLDISNIFGFEMGQLLKDKASLGPALSYVFHRINSSLDGTPSMIVLDEAWALIDNPIFAPKIKDWLKVLRKLNTFVIFATQSVEDASQSAISSTLLQQTATQIFLPNLKATSAYRTAFMLGAREFEIIKTTDPGSRFFLVKQGNDSVVARVDLRGMGDIINILSGRIDTVILLDEVRKKYGDDPKIWMPIFNQRVREMKE